MGSEMCIRDSSQQEVTFVAIPSGLEDGDTLELQINSVDLAAPALTVTVVDGDTQETVANSLQTEIADLGLGLSAEIVVADPQDPDAPTGIQITAPPGVDLASAELSLSSEILGSSETVPGPPRMWRSSISRRMLPISHHPRLWICILRLAGRALTLRP